MPKFGTDEATDAKEGPADSFGIRPQIGGLSGVDRRLDYDRMLRATRRNIRARTPLREAIGLLDPDNPHLSRPRTGRD